MGGDEGVLEGQRQIALGSDGEEGAIVSLQTTHVIEYKVSSDRTSEYRYDDAEVEGPINKEPSDKMSPLSPKEMGIKRL